MVEKYTLLKVQTKIPAVFLHLYAILLFVIGWGIFYFDDFANMGKFFTSAFAQGGELTDFSVESALFDHFWLWLLALVFCLPVRSFVTQWYDKSFVADTTKTLVSIVILVLSTALLVGATNNAFIYTRF